MAVSCDRVISLSFRLLIASAVGGMLLTVLLGGWSVAGVLFLTVAVYSVSTFHRAYSIAGRSAEVDGGDGDERPDCSYSLIIPLKWESSIVAQTVSSVQRLDYPKALMQVLLVVEEDDYQTRSALSRLNLPGYFEIVNISSRYPHTKGRALLLALKRARGELISVYDAETVPDIEQLKVAARVIEGSVDDVCVQARIGVQNHTDNTLAHLFAVEYHEWFFGYLAKMSGSGVPFGLAGNSFHLRTDVLRRVGGWDPLNVTEDADLGVRLSMNGVRLLLIDSDSAESCPEGVWGWLKQRVRWRKGLLVTLLSHLSSIRWGEAGFVSRRWIFFWSGFLASTLQPLAVMLLLCILLTSSNVESIHVAGDLDRTLSVILLMLLAGNYLLAVYWIRMFSKRTRLRRLVMACLVVPFYWLLHNVAGVVAYVDYVFFPTRWSKTHHPLK